MRQEQFTELKNEVPREGFKGMQVLYRWHGRYRRKLKILFKSCVCSLLEEEQACLSGQGAVPTLSRWLKGAMEDRHCCQSSCTLRSTTTPGLQQGSYLSGGEVIRL